MRKNWDQYFLDIAATVATRSTCDRCHVGCVLVRDKTILSTGYNGSICGLSHCDEVGHLMENNHCIRTVHAEANAIVQAARNGVMIDNYQCLQTYAEIIINLLRNDTALKKISRKAYSSATRYTIEEMSSRYSNGILQALE